MTWYAKPKGGYSLSSTEGTDNIFAMAACWPAWTTEAKAAAIGNSYHEGGLNPWRWQGDSVNMSGGYGLFQYTPASGYINGVSWATPNLSTTSITPGATPEDGEVQCDVMASNYLGKWVPSCWRNYWSTSTYADLYAYRQQVLNTWGDGSSISLAQFGQCQDVDAATFIFLACFEGPRVPNYSVRKNTAWTVYGILGGVTPPTPPVPPDPPGPGSGVPPWLLKKIADKNRGLL